MKKSIIFFTFVLFSSLCFAISNMNLYRNTEFLYHILDNKDIVSEFDEKTGLKKKNSYYTDGQLDFYEQYEYEKDKVRKILYYNSDDSFDGYIQFAYDKRTGVKIKESEFDADNRLVQTIEYDPISENQIKKTKYNDNGSLRTQTIL